MACLHVSTLEYGKSGEVTTQYFNIRYTFECISTDNFFDISTPDCQLPPSLLLAEFDEMR